MIASPPHPSPSVDREVEDIRRALREMHRTIFKWHRAAENVTERVNSPLNKFDTALGTIRSDVANISNSVMDITGKFPSQIFWLAFLLLVDLLILAFALFVLLKIVEGMRKIGRQRRIVREAEAKCLVEEGSGGWRRRRRFDAENSTKLSDGHQAEKDAGQLDFDSCPLNYEQTPCRPLKLPRSILKLHPSAPKIVHSMETLPMSTASPPTAEPTNFVGFNDQKRLKREESAQSKRVVKKIARPNAEADSNRMQPPPLISRSHGHCQAGERVNHPSTGRTHARQGGRETAPACTSGRAHLCILHAALI
uniref:Uncharacterized protein n=1 Tax=Globodera rostochiensis TaxID=31243 RepID=A0A914IGB5_GLORO